MGLVLWLPLRLRGPNSSAGPGDLDCADSAVACLKGVWSEGPSNISLAFYPARYLSFSMALFGMDKLPILCKAPVFFSATFHLRLMDLDRDRRPDVGGSGSCSSRHVSRVLLPVVAAQKRAAQAPIAELQIVSSVICVLHNLREPQNMAGSTTKLRDQCLC